MASFSINAILGHSTQKQQETNDVDLRHTNCVDESSSQQQDQKGERIEGKSSCYQTISMMQKLYLRHKCKVPYYDENMMKMMSTHVSP